MVYALSIFSQKPTANLFKQLKFLYSNYLCIV